MSSGFRKLRAIVSGFKNYAFPNEHFEKLAKERAKICAQCPHANPKKMFRKLLPDNSITHIEAAGCDICGCLLSAKVRQIIEPCPDGRWE